jgi:hypothetical protein
VTAVGGGGGKLKAIQLVSMLQLSKDRLASGPPHFGIQPTFSYHGDISRVSGEGVIKPQAQQQLPGYQRY